MREITSASNPFIKQLRALVASKKSRQENSRCIVEGWRAIDTLLRHENRQYLLETLVISPEWIDDPRLEAFNARAANAGQAAPPGESGERDLVLLSDHLFEKVSDVRSTQGVLAIVRCSPPARLHEIPATGYFLLLDNIRDPGNMGTLIRSAVGAGFDGVLLYGDCVELFNPKVIRSTMGTFACCNIWTVDDGGIAQLVEQGYDLCATTGRDGEDLYQTKFENRTVLAIGSEAHGICDSIMQYAGRKITIPLRSECESLNAAVAGSICMFRITRGNY